MTHVLFTACCSASGRRCERVQLVNVGPEVVAHTRSVKLPLKPEDSQCYLALRLDSIHSTMDGCFPAC